MFFHQKAVLTTDTWVGKRINKVFIKLKQLSRLLLFNWTQQSAINTEAASQLIGYKISSAECLFVFSLFPHCSIL